MPCPPAWTDCQDELGESDKLLIDPESGAAFHLCRRRQKRWTIPTRLSPTRPRVRTGAPCCLAMAVSNKCPAPNLPKPRRGKRLRLANCFCARRVDAASHFGRNAGQQAGSPALRSGGGGARRRGGRRRWRSEARSSSVPQPACRRRRQLPCGQPPRAGSPRTAGASATRQMARRAAQEPAVAGHVLGPGAALAQGSGWRIIWRWHSAHGGGASFHSH